MPSHPFKHLKACSRCSLRERATQVVVGSGSLSSPAMLMGEAPGELEDETGLPFVGRSGAFLFDEIMPLFGISREDFYVTNIVKCRPERNVDPGADAIRACRAHLDYQIEVIRPRVIVPVGRFAMNYFVSGAKISQAHGNSYKWKGKIVVPLLHPAYVLRNRRPAVLENYRTGVEALAEVILALDDVDTRLFKGR